MNPLTAIFQSVTHIFPHSVYLGIGETILLAGVAWWIAAKWKSPEFSSPITTLLQLVDKDYLPGLITTLSGIVLIMSVPNSPKLSVLGVADVGTKLLGGIILIKRGTAMMMAKIATSSAKTGKSFDQ